MNLAKERPIVLNVYSRSRRHWWYWCSWESSVFREKKEEYDKAESELQDAKLRFFPQIEQNNERIKFLQRKGSTVNHQPDDYNSHKRFPCEVRSMSLLQAEDQKVAVVSYFILLLFILIEISPIFVKLISNRGRMMICWRLSNLERVQRQKNHTQYQEPFA